jgi:hypothetical protein
VFVAGDMVAAPGLLSEVSFNSAIDASRRALHWQRYTPPPAHRPRAHAAPSAATAEASREV